MMSLGVRKTIMVYEFKFFLNIKTRLVVHKNNDSEIDYNCAKYQDQLYHFNKTERTFCYEHDVNAEGFDHCYDVFFLFVIFFS